MNDLILANLGASATPLTVLTVMVASLILLSLRAWIAATGVTLTRRVWLMLDVAIVVLTVLFVVLVYVRFKTLV